jgi:hypothetical protein
MEEPRGEDVLVARHWIESGDATGPRAADGLHLTFWPTARVFASSARPAAGERLPQPRDRSGVGGRRVAVASPSATPWMERRLGARAGGPGDRPAPAPPGPAGGRWPAWGSRKSCCPAPLAPIVDTVPVACHSDHDGQTQRAHEGCADGEDGSMLRPGSRQTLSQRQTGTQEFGIDEGGPTCFLPQWNHGPSQGPLLQRHSHNYPGSAAQRGEAPPLLRQPEETKVRSPSFIQPTDSGHLSNQETGLHIIFNTILQEKR